MAQGRGRPKLYRTEDERILTQMLRRADERGLIKHTDLLFYIRPPILVADLRALLKKHKIQNTSHPTRQGTYYSSEEVGKALDTHKHDLDTPNESFGRASRFASSLD